MQGKRIQALETRRRNWQNALFPLQQQEKKPSNSNTLYAWCDMQPAMNK